MRPVYKDIYIAIGDSLAEGLCDERNPDGSYRGWADRVAERLAGRSPALKYANLAVRGKLLHQILREQVPIAARSDAGLVMLSGGFRDVLRPRCDFGRTEATLRKCVETLAVPGRTVVLFLPASVRRRAFKPPWAARNVDRLACCIDALVSDYGCLAVDLYSADVFDDSRMWAHDRFHLSPEGHRRVAEAALETIGMPPRFDWRRPLPPRLPARWTAARSADLSWAVNHLIPWLACGVLRRSAGDRRAAKRPEPRHVDLPATPHPAGADRLESPVQV